MLVKIVNVILEQKIEINKLHVQYSSKQQSDSVERIIFIIDKIILIIRNNIDKSLIGKTKDNSEITIRFSSYSFFLFNILCFHYKLLLANRYSKDLATILDQITILNNQIILYRKKGFIISKNKVYLIQEKLNIMQNTMPQYNSLDRKVM